MATSSAEQADLIWKLHQNTVITYYNGRVEVLTLPRCESASLQLRVGDVICCVDQVKLYILPNTTQTTNPFLC